MTVGIRIGENDDLAVSKPREIECLSEAAAKRRHQIRQFLVLEHLRERRALGVEDFSPQRKNRLPRTIAPLLCRPAGGITLDDEQLAVVTAWRGAVAQLAGERQAIRRRGLSRHFLLRRAARLSRARSEDDARDDGFGHRDVRVQPVLQRRTHLRIDARCDLRVVQAILRLPLELRVLQEHAEHRDEPLADVFRGERHTFRREVVRVDEIPDRLSETDAESVLVRAARSRRNPVDVTAHVLVRRLRPLQRDVEADAALVVLARERERRVVHLRGAAIRDDLLQVIREPFGVLEDRFLPLPLVFEGDTHALVQVTRDLEPLLDHVGIELDLREDRRVRAEEHGRAGAARGAKLLHGADRDAVLEPLLPRGAVALDGGDELLRQRIHHTRADTVKTAGRLVVARVELAPGVQRGEDHLDGALLTLRVLVHRNPTPIVRDRDRGAVLVERDADVRRVAVHRLVDRVVENFPDEVMQPRGPDAADVHAGALANGLEAFQDGDVFGGICRWHLGGGSGSQVLRFSGSRVLGFGGARFFGAWFLPVSQKPLLMTTCGAAHAGYLSAPQARFVENQLPRTKNPRTREPENPRTLEPSLLFDQQRTGILDQVLDANEEPDRFRSVDDAVIVGEGGVHHRLDRNLAADDHRPFLDRMKPENADLGRVQDRRAEQRSEYPAVGDGEGAPLDICERQRAVFRGLGVLADLLLDLREGEAIGITQHGHDEPFTRADGDADVVIVLQDHLVALDLRVDARKVAERADHRLDEEGRQAEPHAVAILERLLVALPERHDAGHVHLVEGGEHGRGALHFNEAPRDRGAPLRHAHALLGALSVAAAAVLRDRRGGARLLRSRRGRGGPPPPGGLPPR